MAAWVRRKPKADYSPETSTPSPPAMLEIIELSGTPFAMGREHGRRLAEAIHRLAEERLRIAMAFTLAHGARASRQRCLALAHEHLPYHEAFSPAAFAEWQGIAEGADISLAEVFFANALTDFQDVLWQYTGAGVRAVASGGDNEVHGCTSFAVDAAATAGSVPYIGQTWDMHASAEDYVAVFRRRPDDAPASLTVSTAGCLSLVGVNEAGIAVGNNNLRPTDARPGVIYLAMLHEALRQDSPHRAKAAITDAHRASGHNYVGAAATGERWNIETTATRFALVDIDTPTYAHANHYLAEDLRPLEEPGLDRASSQHRLSRLSARLAEHGAPFTPEVLRRVLADHDGGEELCICRHGQPGDRHSARSCAFVVADPAGAALWVTVGPPCQGSLTRVSLKA